MCLVHNGLRDRRILIFEQSPTNIPCNPLQLTALRAAFASQMDCFAIYCLRQCFASQRSFLRNIPPSAGICFANGAFSPLLLRKSSATRCVGGSAPKPPVCDASFFNVRSLRSLFIMWALFEPTDPGGLCPPGPPATALSLIVSGQSTAS